MPDMLTRLLARAVTNRRLKLTVYGSEKCNQRCFYCYQDHRGRHLTDETRDGLINLIAARGPELDVLELAWFGGEPLLAGENLIAVQTAAHVLSREHDFRLIGSMTTNATLLTPHFDTLASHGLHDFQITLEGPREMHDVTRVNANGTPTFDTIWSALAQMRDSAHDLAVTIRLHYRPDEWMRLSDLIPQIDRTFLCDPRFRLLLYPLQRWGGESDGDVPLATEDDYAAIEEVLRGWVSVENAGQVSSPHLADACSTCALCYAAEANAYTISPTGQIGKCTIMQGGKNAIGQLERDGTMAINHSAHSPWLQGLVTRDQAMLACPASAV